jgi:septal ring factor EnvC (AmiA/AmiB activator)
MLKQKIRDIENETHSLKQKIEDKDIQLGMMEKQRQELSDEINVKKSELDTIREKLRDANSLNEQNSKRIAALEQSMRELKQQRDEQRFCKFLLL